MFPLWLSPCVSSVFVFLIVWIFSFCRFWYLKVVIDATAFPFKHAYVTFWRTCICHLKPLAKSTKTVLPTSRSWLKDAELLENKHFFARDKIPKRTVLQKERLFFKYVFNICCFGRDTSVFISLVHGHFPRNKWLDTHFRKHNQPWSNHIWQPCQRIRRKETRTPVGNWPQNRCNSAANEVMYPGK